MDPILDRIVRHLVEKYGCHTVILYGSRVRGDFTDSSDYDLVGFTRSGEKHIHSEIVDGSYVDAFVYPESEVTTNLEQFLRLLGGRVLVEEKGFGSNLLQQVEKLYAAGPKPLPADELEHRRVWIRKMLARMKSEDVEGNYRRAWLLFDLLEYYFGFRVLWYRGPKESFRWLEQNDPRGLELFKNALEPGAAAAQIKRLAGHVLGDRG